MLEEWPPLNFAATPADPVPQRTQLEHVSQSLVTTAKLYNQPIRQVRGQPGQDLGMFCYLLQLLAVIGLNVGTPLRLATPVQVRKIHF